jgi:DNA-binding MarR family transcriptional regulator
MPIDIDLKKIDGLIHSPTRLAVMAMLASGAEVDFTFLRDELELTDGNLATHVRKLEEARYVKCHKSFLDRRPRTSYTITAKGRAAFKRHVAELERIVNATHKLKT